MPLAQKLQAIRQDEAAIKRKMEDLVREFSAIKFNHQHIKVQLSFSNVSGISVIFTEGHDSVEIEWNDLLTIVDRLKVKINGESKVK